MPFMDNIQLLIGTLRVSDSNPMPVKTALASIAPKPAAQVLFGGDIEASVAIADATAIDMATVGYTAGVLQVLKVSGTGSWSVAIYGCDTLAGTYVPLATAAAGAARTVAVITAGGAFDVTDLRSRFIKFVPTLTGTHKANFKFTPSLA